MVSNGLFYLLNNQHFITNKAHAYTHTEKYLMKEKKIEERLIKIKNKFYKLKMQKSNIYVIRRI